MKFLFLVFMMITAAIANTRFKADFPQGPDSELTPGSLCDRPTAYRYQERIPYCERDVDGNLKQDIFQEYRNSGFRLDPKRRQDFKIDHLIPLCMGGSNNEDNLWPQHATIYAQTDAIEQIGCEKLKEGKIKQAKVVQMVIAAKRNLSLVQQTLQYLQSL